jgi:probable rRNA maturation factor
MTVLVADDHPSSGVDPEHLRRLAEAVLSAEGFPTLTELSITLVEDDEMASWNSRALGNSGPTDVLSFPVEAFRPGDVPSFLPDGPPLLIGDIVIAPDYVRRQAARNGVEMDDEISLMVAHGILHLLGYDHQDDADAELMETRERDILASQGRSRR